MLLTASAQNERLFFLYTSEDKACCDQNGLPEMSDYNLYTSENKICCKPLFTKFIY